MSRNETAPTRWPNVLGPPGPPGKIAFLKASSTHASVAQDFKVEATPSSTSLNFNSNKKIKKRTKYKKQNVQILNNHKITLNVVGKIKTVMNH